MLFAAYGGLVLAPPDYQQKDAFRIIYVHAPSAIMSLQVYVVMAIAAAVGIIWRIKLAHAVAAACAPIGAGFTVVALATGSIYGKPMWGTWWEWDPRITTELIQLFLYLGYMALRASFDDTQRADRASAILAIVGVVNVPIVKYSVVWWNSLHQAPTHLEDRQALDRAVDGLAALHDVARLYALLRRRAVRPGAQRNPEARAQRELAA